MGGSGGARAPGAQQTMPCGQGSSVPGQVNRTRRRLNTGTCANGLENKNHVEEARAAILPGDSTALERGGQSSSSPGDWNAQQSLSKTQVWRCFWSPPC